ncbi:MAG: hypothetical protein QM758_16870 [Armatimonas sp.]
MKPTKYNPRIVLVGFLVFFCSLVLLNGKRSSYKETVLSAIGMSVNGGGDLDEIDIHVRDFYVYTQVDVGIASKNKTMKYFNYLYVCGEDIGGGKAAIRDAVLYKLLNSIPSSYFDKRQDYGLSISMPSSNSMEAKWLPARPGGFTIFRLNEKGDVEVHNGA